MVRPTQSREILALTLEEHGAWLDQTAVYMGMCDCGWKGDDHNGHVADMILRLPKFPKRKPSRTYYP